MRLLPPSPIFTLASAREFGWTDSALCRAVQAGHLIRVRRGVYATPGAADPAIAARAAALAYPTLPLSDLSAARMLGIPIVGCRATKPEMIVPPRSNADLHGIHPYRARRRDHDTVVVDATLVSSPARTVVDIARHRSAFTSVSAIDYVLHEKLASAGELRDVFEFCRTWPGARKARRALRLADSRAESPLESVSRLVIPRLGLPAPEPQVWIYDESGSLIGRGDFYWDEFGVIGEADGRSKYDNRDVIFREKDREEDLEETGLEATRWGWQRVYFEQSVLERRIRSAFERGLLRDRAAQPRRWTAVSSDRVIVPV